MLLGKTTAVMGHLRYPTSGAETDTQPFYFEAGEAGEAFVLVHNGTAYPEGDQGSSDTWRIGNMIQNLGGFNRENVQSVLAGLDGAYNLMFLTSSGAYIAVDPTRFHPLRAGVLRDGTGCVVASEDTALLAKNSREDFQQIEDAPRGVFAKVAPNGLEPLWQDPRTNEYDEGRCSFEPGYIMSHNNPEVAHLRLRWGQLLGEQLARDGVESGAHIVPVLNSGLLYAEGVRNALLHCTFAYDDAANVGTLLKKIEPSQRTFIESDANRQGAIVGKYEVLPDVLGKDIVLVDDSMVRGNTMKRVVVEMLRAGAASVHLAIGLPHITDPCFHGVAFATKEELIFNMLDGDVSASKEYERLFAQWVVLGSDLPEGADSCVRLTHLPLEDFRRELGDEWCYHCMTGELPQGVEVPVSVRTQSGYEA